MTVETKKSYLGAAREYNTAERSYLVERFFSNFGDSARTKFTPAGAIAGQVTYDLVQNAYSAAPSVNFGAAGVNTTLATDWHTANLKPILLNGNMNSAFAVNTYPGHTPYDEDPQLADAAAEIFAQHLAMITARESLDAIMALRTGCVRAYDSTGTVMTPNPLASYWTTPLAADSTGVPDSSDPCVAPSTKWDANGADILGDIETWQGLMNGADHGGAAPDALIVAQDVWAAMFKNADVKDILDNRRMNFGELESGEQLDGFVRYKGHLSGLDVLVCPASIKLGGQSIPFMPSGTAVMAASRFAANKMYYGANMVAREGSSLTTEEGRVVSHIYLEHNPPAYVVQTASTPLPVVRRKWDALSIRQILT